MSKCNSCKLYIRIDLPLPALVETCVSQHHCIYSACMFLCVYFIHAHVCYTTMITINKEMSPFTQKLPEEEAFTILVKLMYAYSQRDLFKANFKELMLMFYQLDKLVEVGTLYMCMGLVCVCVFARVLCTCYGYTWLVRMYQSVHVHQYSCMLHSLHTLPNTHTHTHIHTHTYTHTTHTPHTHTPHTHTPHTHHTHTHTTHTHTPHTHTHHTHTHHTHTHTTHTHTTHTHTPHTHTPHTHTHTTYRVRW